MKKIFNNKLMFILLISLFIFLGFSTKSHATCEIKFGDETYYFPDLPEEVTNSSTYFLIHNGDSSTNSFNLYFFNDVSSVKAEHSSTGSLRLHLYNEYGTIIKWFTNGGKRKYFSCTASSSSQSAISLYWRNMTIDGLPYDMECINLSNSSFTDFALSNINIYDYTTGDLVFRPPLPEMMVGLLPAEELLPTPLTQNLAEIIPTILLTALMIFSALVIPFLIRWVISRLR